MTRRYVPLLLVLSLVWGASYLFIKVAGEDIPPATMMFLRLLVASLLLHAFLFATKGGRSVLADLRAAWRPGLVLGVINGALPFTLIAWGEQHIDSGVAAIGNSAVPIFNAALAVWLLPSERVNGMRLVGLLVGLVGVGVLVGLNPGGDSLALYGTLAVIGSSVSYAFAGLYGQKRVSSVSGPVLAASSTFFGALVLIPFAAIDPPTAAPGWEAVASLAALTVIGTAFAQLVLYRMLRLHGSARTSLVTYLMPIMALGYGALLLNEPITAAMAGGLLLILAGVALASGKVRLSRRGRTAAEPA